MNGSVGKRSTGMRPWVAPVGLFLVLGALATGVPAAGSGCDGPPSHDDAFSEEGLLTSDAAALTSTVVVPHQEVPLAGRNVLWCGTFQLAWNELYGLFGEPVRFAPPEPAMVAALNRRAFTRDHLDAASYVAIADFVRNGVHDRISRALESKFQGRASPSHAAPDGRTSRPQDVVAYAYLFKHLEFAMPFERLDAPLDFGGTAVASFGLGDEYKPGHADLLGQFSVLGWTGPDDFIVELETKTPGDRVILARVAPAADLAATVAAVSKRVADAEPVAPGPGDVLKVPKLNFDITREYGELLGKRLTVRNPAVAKDLQVVTAVQNIRFQLNELGVKLKSESRVGLGCSAGARPAGKHRLVFDAPFLLLMQRTDADQPYFALWVDNSELLVKTR